jgi:Cu2+-containing amine oxidase
MLPWCFIQLKDAIAMGISCGSLLKRERILPILLLLILSLNCQAQELQSASPSLQTAPDYPSHPLDPLTAKEFAILKGILQNKGNFSDKTVYNWVQLREPSKEEVLAFQPGQKFRREAQVVAVSLDKKTAYEVLVDLNTQEIESIKDLGNLQPRS